MRTRKNALLILFVFTSCMLTGCKDDDTEQESLENLSEYELARLLASSTHNPKLAIRVADELSASKNPKYQDLQTLWNTAYSLDNTEERDRIRQAAFQLCVRMMNNEIMGVLPLNAAHRFVDYALEVDNHSILAAVERVLGADHGQKAFEVLSKLLTREQKRFGFYDGLERLIRRIPEADLDSLEPELVQFRKLVLEDENVKMQPSSSEIVILSPELNSTFAILTLSDCISPCGTDTYD